jgi:DNA-binding CsgD family transcriptional regulator
MSFWTDLLRAAIGRATAHPSAGDPSITTSDARVTSAVRVGRDTAPRTREPTTAPRTPYAPDHARDGAVQRRRSPASHATRAPEPEAADQIGRWQTRVLELLSDGVLLLHADGSVTYRNAAAAALLTDDGDPLLREARALAAEAMKAVADGARRRSTGADAACDLSTAAILYRLSAVVMPAPLLHGDGAADDRRPTVLVTIARSSSALPSPSALRARFQLTAREASVALLLAEGRSNGSIARRLGISASTARHYTESVLLKLDVPTRAAVAAVLLGIYHRTDEHALPPGRPGAPPSVPH